MTSQTQSNIKVILLLLLLFCPVFDVAPSREENNTRLGNTFFITSMYLGVPRDKISLGVPHRVNAPLEAPTGVVMHTYVS
jgi:hypothetical protein